jgi:helicase required for RNAi-mediated heterochromatin assembly 1
VHIVGYTMSQLGPAARVEFSYERAGRRIRWEQSKRLTQGTIVAITPQKDNFKTCCKVAVVAARPMVGLEANPPQIDLFWADPDQAEIDPLEPFTMIEARTGYFESFRHMLVAMQKVMTERYVKHGYILKSMADVIDFHYANILFRKSARLTHLNTSKRTLSRISSRSSLMITWL